MHETCKDDDLHILETRLAEGSPDGHGKNVHTGEDLPVR